MLITCQGLFADFLIRLFFFFCLAKSVIGVFPILVAAANEAARCHGRGASLMLASAKYTHSKKRLRSCGAIPLQRCAGPGSPSPGKAKKMHGRGAAKKEARETGVRKGRITAIGRRGKHIQQGKIKKIRTSTTLSPELGSLTLPPSPTDQSR